MATSVSQFANASLRPVDFPLAGFWISGSGGERTLRNPGGGEGDDFLRGFLGDDEIHGGAGVMADLDEALNLVASRFRGVKDKSGAPYVLHCIRAMMTVQSMDAKMVAVMHDLVEDTPMTLEQLQECGFSEVVIKGVDLVTHRDDVTYADYIVAIKGNAIATEVKLADLKDNTALERTLYREKTSEKDCVRIQKYILSFQFLTDAIDEASYRRQMSAL